MFYLLISHFENFYFSFHALFAILYLRKIICLQTLIFSKINMEVYLMVSLLTLVSGAISVFVIVAGG